MAGRHAATPWWAATANRVAATVLAALTGLVWPVYSGELSLTAAGLTLGLTVVLTVATAFAALPEVDGTEVPRWRAIATRTLRTFAQTVVSGIGTAVLLTDVDWRALLAYAATSALVTLLRTILMHLPEEARQGLAE